MEIGPLVCMVFDLWFYFTIKMKNQAMRKHDTSKFNLTTNLLFLFFGSPIRLLGCGQHILLILFFFSAVQTEDMATKWSGFSNSIKCEEDTHNGWYQIYWCIFVKTAREGGPSGTQIRISGLNLLRTFLFHICLQGVSFSGWRLNLWFQVTLFTRGKAPVTQPLPGESDQEYADFSSKVNISKHQY